MRRFRSFGAAVQLSISQVIPESHIPLPVQDKIDIRGKDARTTLAWEMNSLGQMRVFVLHEPVSVRKVVSTRCAVPVAPSVVLLKAKLGVEDLERDFVGSCITLAG